MTRARRKAFTLVQLILAVFVMAVFIRIVFHVGDGSDARHTNHDAASYKYHGPYMSKLEKFPHALPAFPEVEEATAAVVLPIKPLDRDRGPLLARVLRQHRPLTTDEQVDGLVDTLPPSASPSVIVILPSVEKPETPDAEKSCTGNDEAEASDGEETEDKVIAEDVREDEPEAHACCHQDV
ncbi:hypothetical protein OT109_08990 [Phycisphaeraceae bacterium D3-23]